MMKKKRRGGPTRPSSRRNLFFAVVCERLLGIQKMKREYVWPPIYQIDPPGGFSNRVSDIFDETLRPVFRYRRYLISWMGGYITVCAWMEESVANRALSAMSPEGIGQMRLLIENPPRKTARAREKKARRGRRRRTT